MAYEYEDKINEAFFKAGRDGRNMNRELLKELQEVYRKAKAFDKVLKIDNQATDEDKITGQYESDIETVISNYSEDK